MNRIRETFAKLGKEGKKALIIYITAGYPDLDSTAEIAEAVCSAGADIIELGIPFSDPLADGPTIQESSLQALRNKTDFKGVFNAVKTIRKKTAVPLVFMSYYNPVYAYGIERLAKKMRETGIDGIIVPDLPVEECRELKSACRENNIALILLAASNTPDERLKMIAAGTSGFIYCLSHLGVTGAQSGLQSGADEFIGRLREITVKPLAVGFGVSKPGHVSIINSYADGAIVGSAVIEVIKKNSGKKDLAKKTSDFVKRLKSG